MSPLQSDKDVVQVTHGKENICAKQENGDDSCLLSPATSVSWNYVELSNWIIKPLADGICVEGHRRLPDF